MAIKTIPKTAGFKTCIVDELYRKRIVKLSIIIPAQIARKYFTMAIPYDKGAANIFKKEAMKHNVNIPINANKNIFQRIRNEKDRIDDMKTSCIYRINLKNEKEHENITME